MGTTTIADSAKEFSGTQGYKNWQYGYYDGKLISTSFKLLPVFYTASDPKAIGWWYSGGNEYWTLVDPIGGHPHGPVSTRPKQIEQWSVRRWTSDYTGTIRISGNINDINRGGGGDGITGRIIFNGDEVYSAVVNHASKAEGVNYSITLNVTKGQAIDFAIDPNAADGDDSTQFTASIELIEPPIVRGNSLYTIVDGPSWTQAEANSVKLGGI